MDCVRHGMVASVSDEKHDRLVILVGRCVIHSYQQHTQLRIPQFLPLLITTTLSYLFLDSPDPSSQFRLAIGSYVEQYSNAVQIVKKHPGGDSYHNQLYQACEFDHPYPCTKILWSPDSRNMGGKDLLATTGDYLRVWNVTDDGSGRGTLTPKKEGLLNNVRRPIKQQATSDKQQMECHNHSHITS